MKDLRDVTHRRPAIHRWSPAAVVALGLLVAACGGEGEDASRRIPLDQMRSGTGSNQARSTTPGRGFLTEGNTAYRAGDYEEARDLYRRAAEEMQDPSPAWFGVHMAERALGNEDAARQALDRAGGLSGAAPMHGPGADSAETGGDGPADAGGGGATSG